MIKIEEYFENDEGEICDNFLEMPPIGPCLSATSKVTTANIFPDEKKRIVSTESRDDSLENDDLEKKIDSEILPQRRLFSFLYSKKIPDLPQDEERKYLPFVDWNPFSRFLYLWCFKVLYVGYKRTLQPQDCYKLPKEQTVEYMYDKFMVKWEESLARKRERKLNHKKEPKFSHLSIIWTLFCTFKWTYSYAILCFIVSNAVSAFNPLIVKALINFVEQRQNNPNMKINNGVGYTIGTVLLMLLGSISYSQGYSHAFFVGVYSRSILTKALLAKSLKLSAKGRHDFPMSKITTVATTDLSRVEIAFSNHPYLWSFPISLIIALILLITNIGPVSLVGVGYFVLSLFFSSFGFRKILNFRLRANMYTDERVSFIREILNSLKIIKYYAWENAYENLVTDKRKKEVGEIKKMQYIQSTVVAHGLLVPTLASLITFLILFKVSPNHSAASIFSSLSLFNILSSQMLFVPNCVGHTINAIIALGRTQEILLADEQEEFLENVPCTDPENSIELVDCTFEWERFDNMLEDLCCEDEEDTGKIEDDGFYKEHGKENYIISDITCNTVQDSELIDISSNVFNGLKNIDFNVKKGEFVVVTGSIGTGKTSLLLALTHLMKQTSGDFMQNGELLLCGQPWVQNATIRNNIIFGNAFDPERYSRTIDICSLNDDLKALPGGEFTEIGERGITLSGGQKARINLARTVYREVDIYLFDDILSAVDARVGKHIMEKCILGALSGKTRILATHQLNLIRDADRVIFLGSDGSFNINTMDNLLAMKPEFASLMSNATASALVEDEEEEEEKEEKDKDEEQENGSKDALETKQKDEVVKKIVPTSAPDDPSKEDCRLIEAEEKAVNSVGTAIYKEFIKAGTGKYWILIIAVLLLVCAITTFFSLFSSVWLSFWTAKKYHFKKEFYMGFYGLWNVLFFIFILIEIVSIGTISVTASQNLHTSAVHNILHAPMAYMDVTPIGRILNRFTKDIDILDNQMPYVSVLFFYIACDIIGVIIMCIIYMPWFALAIPFLCLMYIAIANHYQSSGLELKRLESVQRSFVYNNFNEVLSGLDTIKCYRLERMFLDKSDGLTNTQNESGFLYLFLQRWSSVWIVNLVICFAIIMIFLCISKIFNMNASSVGLLLTYVLQLSLTVKELLYVSTQLENYMNSVERIVSYSTDLPQEKEYTIAEMKPADSWPEKANISFENVSLAYRPGLPLVLKNVTIDIKGGEKIGICGRTGAGKSTIMSALYRIVELSAGRVVIDGVDISKIGLYDLRSKLSIIPQEPVLFKGDIRRNLDPFGLCTDNQLWDTLVRGGAFEHDYLEHIKNQKVINGDSSKLHKFHLNQTVEDDGANFSLGERQLLTLARALVRGSKIQVLDEATSSVDYETDAKIQSKIAEGFADSTILCIAHRLKTIINYDKILVLEKGEVAEYDAPLTLFKQEGGIFRDMCMRSGISEADFC